ncbi:hypothetical protein CHS0354_030610 [Potamilus streckersoni]|uniref:Uncharacterized protein n=1 Tax=Potamilus streckersoni TaxID=2493646 RepID=A0AAE0VUC9_9BIVA|nr:hypothetical protein CHS0354_030610 [Potamilus streckersoni]
MTCCFGWRKQGCKYYIDLVGIIVNQSVYDEIFHARIVLDGETIDDGRFSEYGGPLAAESTSFAAYVVLETYFTAGVPLFYVREAISFIDSVEAPVFINDITNEEVEPSLGNALRQVFTAEEKEQLIDTKLSAV